MFLPNNIQIQINTFGPDTITVSRPLELCLSARKEYPITAADDLQGSTTGTNYKCYAAASRTGSGSGPVAITDQFGQHEDASLRLSRLCTPVGVNEPAPAPDGFLACYDIIATQEGAPLPLDADVEDILIQAAVSQDIRMTVERASRFCETASVPTQ